MMDWAPPTIQEILLMKIYGEFFPSENGPSASIATCQHYTCSIKKDVYEVFLIAELNVTALMLIDKSRTCNFM